MLTGLLNWKRLLLAAAIGFGVSLVAVTTASAGVVITDGKVGIDDCNDDQEITNVHEQRRRGREAEAEQQEDETRRENEILLLAAAIFNNHFSILEIEGEDLGEIVTNEIALEATASAEAGGCAATGSSSWLLFALLPLLFRRRRA